MLSLSNNFFLIKLIRENLFLFSLIAILLILGCELTLGTKNGKVENAFEPYEKIIGSWVVKEVVTDYNYCSWGTDEFNHYYSYDPSDQGYWHYFINSDSTFMQERSTNGNLSEDTGFWDLIDGTLTLKYENKIENWSAGFTGNDILTLSYLIDCSHGGSIYSTRKWERRD